MGDDRERRLCWLADFDVDPRVELTGGEVLDREAFLGWLWEIAGDAGLLAISEGSVDVAEAAALGLVESPLVLDAAAAPVDRDWVGSRAAARVTCGFDAEVSRHLPELQFTGPLRIRVDHLDDGQRVGRRPWRHLQTKDAMFP